MNNAELFGLIMYVVDQNHCLCSVHCPGGYDAVIYRADGKYVIVVEGQERPISVAYPYVYDSPTSAIAAMWDVLKNLNGLEE